MMIIQLSAPMKGLMRMIICLRNISINSLHTGDDDDDDYDDDNNTIQCSDEGADANDSLSQECKLKYPA